MTRIWRSLPAPSSRRQGGPAYHLAKLIIKLINDVAAVIDADPAVRGRLKVLFLPEYNVSLAERLDPASECRDLDGGL